MTPILNKLHLILLTCVAATLPFNIPFAFSNVKLNNVFIVATAVNAVLYILVSRRKPGSGRGFMTGLFVALYCLYIIGLIPTQDLPQGLFELEKKVGIALFPLLFYFLPGLSAKEIKNVVLGFALSCAATAMFCLAVAFYRYFSLGSTEYFSYHKLSQIAGMHAVYLSMYCCFSIAIVAYVVSASRGLSTKIKFSAVLLILFLAVFIFLLAGRTHIFVLIMGAMTYVGYLVSKRYNIGLAMIAAATIGVFVLCIALLFPASRERFKRAINYKGQYGLDREWGEQQMRPLIWDCVLERFAESPVFGTGTGDVQADLQACYVKKDYVSLLIFEPQRFNAHNEFFEMALGLGLIGLTLFLLTLALTFKHAVENRNLLYGIFLAIIIISCLTESLFEKHQGVVFFSFFNALLFYHGDKLSTTLRKTISENATGKPRNFL